MRDDIKICTSRRLLAPALRCGVTHIVLRSCLLTEGVWWRRPPKGRWFVPACRSAIHVLSQTVVPVVTGSDESGVRLRETLIWPLPALNTTESGRRNRVNKQAAKAFPTYNLTVYFTSLELTWAVYLASTSRLGLVFTMSRYCDSSRHTRADNYHIC